jgi:hypothetical protein
MQAVLHRSKNVAGILSSSYAHDVNIRRARIAPPVALCDVQCQQCWTINATLKGLTNLGTGKRCADWRMTSRTIENRLGVKAGDDKVSRDCIARAGTAHCAKDQVEMKTCLRCGTLYSDDDNGADACHFHGDTTGIYLFSFSGLHIIFFALCTLLSKARKKLW